MVGSLLGGAEMSAEPGLTDSEQYAKLWQITGYHTSSLPRSVQGRLEEAARLRSALDELTLRLVDDARSAGLAWEAIGFCLGVSKQAVSQMHKRAQRSGGVRYGIDRKGRPTRVR